ncbi:serine hydrolase domain-containing protein [Uliginosibacterium sp. H1]|uniref:serine hydrolase domain-containing protein n=1 Tax=Uliginosibacterium sp. H1 TaxID=3114757 RepID=UPI002E19CD3A|nr:serine hydrolase domain-containing protein [Uliginosibacterium sp. H1]
MPIPVPHLTRTAALATGLTLAPLAAAQTTVPADPLPRFAALNAAIDRAIAEQRIVGTVVLVAHEGRLVYHRAAGLADREAGTPMREDAIFLLASVTKPIVTVAAMRLVEQGRLRLDDPVTRWLPDFHPASRDGSTPVITVHQLLTHSAGLSYDFMQPAEAPYQQLQISNGLNRPELGLAENLSRITRAGLIYEPGTAWGYSMATDVLGAVIEKVSGQSLPEAVATLVTTPLAMHDTAFTVRDPQRLVTHYGDGEPGKSAPVRMGESATVPFFGAPVSFSPRRILDDRAYASGGAGMAGTAADFLRLAELLQNRGGELLRPATVADMLRPHVGAHAQTQGPGWGFGYGGAVLVDPVVAQTPQSAGSMRWGGAYGHNWFIDPRRRLTVVAFTNTTFEGMAGAYVRDVRDAVYQALTAAGEVAEQIGGVQR